MSQAKIMAWVDKLPRVEVTDFQKRRDEIAELQAKAVAMQAEVDILKAQAYFAACRLTGDARRNWPQEVVDAVMNGTTVSQ
jgi:hypothetical protein